MAGKCSKCGQKLTFRNTALSNPPSCMSCLNLEAMHKDSSEIGSEEPESIADFSKGDESMSSISASSDKLLSREARVAIESARIVNTYGSLIQVLGIVFGLINAGGGFYLTNYSGDVVWVVGGVISGLAIIFICVVQGALFRMASNYVVARLKD
jgi:hypothetical protein